MRWFQTNPGPASSDRRRDAGTTAYRQSTELIRSALIKALEGSAPHSTRSLLMRIRYTTDPVLLWYLRPEVMSVVASLHGEVHARNALLLISPLFHDVLPDGLACKLQTLKETA